MKIVKAALIVVVFVVGYLLGSFFPFGGFPGNAAADRLVLAAWHLEPFYIALEKINAGDVDGSKDSLQASTFGTLTGMHIICETEGPINLSTEYQKVVTDNVVRSKPVLNEYIAKGVDPGFKSFLENPSACFK